MKGEKFDNFKHLKNHHNYPTISTNQTTKSKNNILSLKEETPLYSQINLNSLTNKTLKNENLIKKSRLTGSNNKRANNRTFNLEISISNQLRSGDLKSYVNTNKQTNTRIKEYLNSKLLRANKMSPSKNNSANESQLKSCLENYVKNSRKMRNLSESQQFFKTFNRGSTKGGGIAMNNNSVHQNYISFNDLYKKKNSSRKNSNISSLNNSINDKLKNNLLSNTALGGNNDRHVKTNSVISFCKARNSKNSNSDLKRNISYLCENSSNVGSLSDLKSNNSNLITKCNSKQKINAETNPNSTPNNIASPLIEKDATISSPGQIDSTRNKLSSLKSNLMDLIKNKGNNKKLMSEIELLCKNILSQHSSLTSSNNTYPNNEMELLDFNNYFEQTNNKDNVSQIKIENAQLKQENIELKTKLDLIDKKFDIIIQENENLKKFIEKKSDNFEVMQNNLVRFEKILNELKDNNNSSKEKSLNVNQNRSEKDLKFKKIIKAPSTNNIKKTNPNLPKPTYNLTESTNNMNKTKNASLNKSKFTKHKPHKSIVYQSNIKMNPSLKFNETKDNLDMYDIESLNYSQYIIDNPKDLFYFPQKVNLPQNSLPMNVPKLNLKHKNEHLFTESDMKSKCSDLNQSLFDDLKTPGTNNLDKAFLTNETLSVSGKKVAVEKNNLFKENETETKKVKRNKSNNSTNPSSKQNFALNFENLPKADYHKEFIAQFDDFSPSWRKECMKMKGFDPNNEN